MMTALRAGAWAIVVAAGIVTGRAQASLAGTWELEMRWPDGQVSTGTCVFEQTDDTLSGTCGGDKDRFPAKGRVVAGDVSWEVDIKQGGADAVMEYTGKADSAGTTVTGICRIIGVQSGAFTLKRRAA